tara:strand:+ start:165 stop:452 length:288 start_codon:yes stop_codon:yes gene_type:complete
MSIDKEKIKHIAKLARISVDRAKTESLTKDLNSIFEFIEQLNQLNTDKVEPMTSILNESLRYRTDQVSDGKIRDKILKNSPKTSDEFFIVPKVIE